jgi:hypothetical protein
MYNCLPLEYQEVECDPAYVLVSKYLQIYIFWWGQCGHCLKNMGSVSAKKYSQTTYSDHEPLYSEHHMQVVTLTLLQSPFPYAASCKYQPAGQPVHSLAFFLANVPAGHCVYVEYVYIFMHTT